MSNTENNVAAQAGDSERSPFVLGVKPSTWDAQIAAQAGDEPMRSAFEATCKSTPYRSAWNDGADYAVGHVELAWKAFKAGAEFAAQVSPRATADVERVMMECLIALSIGYTQTNDDGNEVCADCDVDHASAEDHSPGCLVLRARAARAQLAAIATTKPGA